MFSKLLSELRPNVLLLVLIAGAMLVTAHLFGLSVGESVTAYVSGVMILAGRLLDPPPDPTIPASALDTILRRRD